MKIILTSLYANPIHPGHIEYLYMAKNLGDKLVVIVNNDFQQNLKIGKIYQNENFRLNAACENLTDARYRVFASGINAPGRNFIISLRYKF